MATEDDGVGGVPRRPNLEAAETVLAQAIAEWSSQDDADIDVSALHGPLTALANDLGIHVPAKFVLFIRELGVSAGWMAGAGASGRQASQGLWQGMERLAVALPHCLEPDFEPGLPIELVNDLRCLRGIPLLTENPVFDPPSVPVSDPVSQRVGQPLHGSTKQLRATFQLGLLRWLRGAQPEGGMNDILNVCAKLTEIEAGTPSGQLWFVAEGFCQALRDEGLRDGPAIRRLLSQLDVELKRAADGARGLNEPPPTGLMRSLLFYVGRARSRGAQTVAVREAFALAQPRDSRSRDHGVRLWVRERLKAAASAGPTSEGPQDWQEELRRVADALAFLDERAMAGRLASLLAELAGGDMSAIGPRVAGLLGEWDGVDARVDVDFSEFTAAGDVEESLDLQFRRLGEDEDDLQIDVDDESEQSLDLQLQPALNDENAEPSLELSEESELAEQSLDLIPEPQTAVTGRGEFTETTFPGVQLDELARRTDALAAPTSPTDAAYLEEPAPLAELSSSTLDLIEPPTPRLALSTTTDESVIASIETVTEQLGAQHPQMLEALDRLNDSVRGFAQNFGRVREQLRRLDSESDVVGAITESLRSLASGQDQLQSYVEEAVGLLTRQVEDDVEVRDRLRHIVRVPLAKHPWPVLTTAAGQPIQLRVEADDVAFDRRRIPRVTTAIEALLNTVVGAMPVDAVAPSLDLYLVRQGARLEAQIETHEELTLAGVSVQNAIEPLREAGARAGLAGSLVWMHLPLIGQVCQVIIVEAGGRAFALPTTQVQEILNVPGGAIVASVSGAYVFEHRGNVYRVVDLERLFGTDTAAGGLPQRETVAVLVLSGDEPVALAVDRVGDCRQAVIATPAAEDAVEWLVATGQLADGDKLPMVDVPALVGAVRSVATAT